MATTSGSKQPDAPTKTSATKQNDTQPSASHRATLEPVDKSDTRSFQTGTPEHPEGRENLTKEEARARGFHWLDTDEPKGKKA